MLTDIIVVGAFVAFAVLGYFRGLTRSAVSLVRISISVIIAFLLASPIAKLLNNLFRLSNALAKAFNTSAGNGNLILIAIVTIVIFIILRVVLMKLVRMADKAREDNHVFSYFDRWLGALFGVLRFVFLFSILAIAFRFITFIPFLKSLRDVVFGGSTVALWLYNLVTNIILSEALSAATTYFAK